MDTEWTLHVEMETETEKKMETVQTEKEKMFGVLGGPPMACF